jgi:hypothetical protein
VATSMYNTVKFKWLVQPLFFYACHQLAVASVHTSYHEAETLLPSSSQLPAVRRTHSRVAVPSLVQLAGRGAVTV